MANNNYQDEAEMREYKKGEAAGKQQASSQRGRKQKSHPSRKKSGSKQSASGGGVFPVTTGSQPLAYLAKYPHLVSDAASISFERAVGNAIPLKMDPANQVELDEDSPYPAYPAILKFSVITTIGGAENNTDGFNLANHALYAYIRSKNTGVPPFDPAMVGFYMQAVTECLKCYSWIVRGIGLSNYITPNSNVAPYALMNAAGFNYSEVSANVENLRGRLNKIALRLSALPVPKGMEYLTVTKWMLEGIFKDSNTNRAQLYCFTPSGFLQLVEGDPNHPLTYLGLASMLGATTTPDCSNLQTTVYSMAKILDVLDGMIQRILGSEDCQRVAAEILKAFDAGSLVSVNPIGEMLTVTPVYDERVSTIVENLTVVGQPINRYMIDQDPSINGGALIERLYVESGLVAKSRQMAQLGNTILNFHKDTVAPIDVMLATCLTSMGVDYSQAIQFTFPGDTEKNFYRLKPHGFAVVTSAHIISTRSATPTSSGWKFNAESFQFYSFNNCGASMTQYTNALNQLSSFDWHPTIYGTTGSWNNSGGTWNGSVINFPPFADLDKFALLEEEVLKNIHEVSVLSGYSSQQLGVYTLR